MNRGHMQEPYVLPEGKRKREKDLRGEMRPALASLDDLTKEKDLGLEMITIQQGTGGKTSRG